MSTALQKEWAAVNGDQILLTADSKKKATNMAITRLDEKYEIVAIPKPHGTILFGGNV